MMKHDIPPAREPLPDRTRELMKIEEETGPLSDAIKALLITDGSVTSLLECFSGSPVIIKTISQEVVTAPADVAEEMDLNYGDKVNHRVVGIYEKKNGIPLIHAVSYCPVHRLPEHARVSLMKADIPIGHILRDEKMESRREIASIRLLEESERPSICTGSVPDERLFARKYQIIHQNRPLFRIEEFVPEHLFSDGRHVTIRTPSRLHLTLIDMNGSLGRVDGGVGITLDQPGYLIRFEQSEETRVIAGDEEAGRRVREIIHHLSQTHGYSPDLKVRIMETIPPHTGLGSGTQLSFAVATAMAMLSGEGGADQDLARMTGRGGTSGIGIRAFASGGVILDGGHRFGPGQEKESYLPSSASSGIKEAPLIGRYEFPEDWRIILTLPAVGPGANGSAEKDIFQRCCPVPRSEVQELSHLILMQMIPALIERDLSQFGASVNALRGLGFKREELALQPPVIHDLLSHMAECGTAGAGMSSFGPALYALCDTNSAALASEIRSYLNERCGGEVRVVKGCNSGASVQNSGYG